jgi:hypothetical protein
VGCGRPLKGGETSNKAILPHTTQYPIDTMTHRLVKHAPHSRLFFVKP